MFAYTDPTGANLLSRPALMAYRELVHAQYLRFARLPRSSFTLLDAFSQLSPGASPQTATVSWIAFPRTANAPFEDIDEQRLQFQDEYVEWRTERSQNGNVVAVTFTTEFPEYYEALAAAGLAALRRGIRKVIPRANPTVEELFGPNFNPNSTTADARAEQFRSHLERNPWNNGTKGILALAQQFNTLGALFNLVGECAIKKPNLPANAVCGNVGGACGKDRNSDPVICEAVQNLARGKNGLSLPDPVGVKIEQLQGVWKLDGRQVDINDPTQNEGAWTVSRNGRRARLDVSKGVTMGDNQITTGTQVATKLQVSATVTFAPESALPAWAKTGQESSRLIV